MSRHLWVVESKERGLEWMAHPGWCEYTRSEARSFVRAIRRRENRDIGRKYRVRKYTPERLRAKGEGS